jgi:hypothetical protein
MSVSHQEAITNKTMKCALDRWKAAWDACTGAGGTEDLQPTGFMRQAAVEFWHLTMTLVS